MFSSATFTRMLASCAQPARPVRMVSSVHPVAFVAIFTVNGAPTDARGITDDGTITGYVKLDNEYEVGFVIPAPKRAGFQTLSVPAKDFVRFPGAAGTFPEGISDDGILAGFWTDRSGITHGFIAAPSSQ